MDESENHLRIESDSPSPSELRLVDSVSSHEALFLELDSYPVLPLTHGGMLFTEIAFQSLRFIAPTGAIRRVGSPSDAWDWADGSAVVLTSLRTYFPDDVERPAPSSKRLSVGGRPMQLDLSDDEPLGFWWAVVRGYLSAEFQLIVQVGARSVHQRDLLLSAVSTTVSV